MRKTRRIISAALCLLMVLSVLPALAEEHGPLWIDGAEGVTLTYWIPIDGTTAQYYETLAEHPFYLWLEEQTGVHVEFIHPSWEQMEQQFNLMIASGNYYDMMYYAEYPDGPQQAILDGVFADIGQYRHLMPHYFDCIACGDGSFSAWEWGEEKEIYHLSPQPAFEDALTTVQGNIWCVSQVWTDALPVECGVLIRQDWLDEAGLPIPQTLAELETVLAAFRARGENVIPMNLGRYGYHDPTQAILSAFGLRGGWFSVHNGVVDPVYSVDARFREYLTLMHDWYQKGYIDPDFMNRENDSVEALLLSDRLGILFNTWSAPEYYEGLYEGTQKFDLSAMSLPRRSTDQVLDVCQGYDSSATNYTVIAAQNENREIAAQWLDRLFTREVILRGQYGVEGESYTLDENGVPYFTPWFYENDPDMLVFTYLAPNATNYWSTRANALSGAEDPSVEGQKTRLSPWYEASAVWGQNANFSSNIGFVSFDGDGWARMYDPYTEADTYFAPMVLKYITGAEDLSTYDQNARKALEMGFAEARNQLQLAYNRQHGQPDDFGMTP